MYEYSTFDVATLNESLNESLTYVVTSDFTHQVSISLVPYLQWTLVIVTPGNSENPFIVNTIHIPCTSSYCYSHSGYSEFGYGKKSVMMNAGVVLPYIIVYIYLRYNELFNAHPRAATAADGKCFSGNH